jgi:3-oxoacyl-[acyl-carrier-protein] synthase II
MMAENRVVVTGMGLLAANGRNVDEFWASLLEGRSGIGNITLFDASGLECQVAGEVSNFDPMDYFSAADKPRRMGRFTQFAGASAIMAIEDAGLTGDDFAHLDQVPVVMGISSSEMTMLADKPTRFTVAASIPHAATSAVGYMFNMQPKLITVSNACASGLDAISIACQLIQSGSTDLAIAGSAEASIARYTLESMIKLRMVSGKHNADPENASRPFDRLRDKGVLAEGGGVVVLENYTHAMARGAEPYAEITGSTSLADPREEPEGAGLFTTMRMAVSNAGHNLEAVDYINAHGPGDTVIDQMETYMIKKAFGAHAYRIPVTSIKGATGNPMGCGGVLQFISTALSIKTSIIPPTTNFNQGEDDCDLDYVPEGPRMNQVRCALINSHGAGRGNVCVVMEPIT